MFPEIAARPEWHRAIATGRSMKHAIAVNTLLFHYHEPAPGKDPRIPHYCGSAIMTGIQLCS